MSKSKLLLAVAEDLRSLADSVQAVANAMLQNEPTVNAEPKTPAPAPQKELTLEEGRAVLGEKSRAGFTAEIQALLQKYGASKLSGIDPKHYAALLKDVEVLKDATYKNSFFVNANSTTAPQIVDRSVQPILDRSEVYSGCYARVSVNFYAFNSNGNRGIACGLGNIQKVRDGEPLGGKSSAADDFATDLDDDFLS